MKTDKQQQQKAKQKTSKRYQNLKNNKQKSENKIQKYTKPEKNNVFSLTRAILIKNEFMTLIFVCVILNKHCKKECVHCRNYNYLLVKKIAKYN